MTPPCACDTGSPWPSRTTPPPDLEGAPPSVSSTDPRAAPLLIGPDEKTQGGARHWTPLHPQVVAHPRQAHSRFSLVRDVVKGVVGEWGLGLQFSPRRRFCVSTKCSWLSILSRRSRFHWAGGVSTESVGR
jgi:hypothetical protein